MYNIDTLQLMAGVDIFIPELQAKIHQPNINEIAVIGERKFFECANLFFINTDEVKAKLMESFPDPSLKALDDYSILLLFLNSSKDFRVKFRDIIRLIFPGYELFIENELIVFNKDNEPEIVFTKEAYSIIKDVIYIMFKFDKLIGSTTLNAQSTLAKKIAEKMQKAKQKIAEMQGPEKQNKSIFSHYISILSIGSNALNIDTIRNLTIYQLYDQFERFGLFSQYQQSLQIAVAGAKTEIVDWFKEIS